MRFRSLLAIASSEDSTVDTSGAVARGQSAPRDEAHHAGLIREQDGRALADQSPDDGIECRFVDLLGSLQALKALGERKKHGLLVHAPRKRILRAFAIGDVVL